MLKLANKHKNKAQGATRSARPERRRPQVLPALQARLSLLLRFWKPALGGLLLVLLVLLALAVPRWLASLDQPITQVQVAGALSQIDKAEVAAWVQSGITDGVLSTDLRSLQADLQARPWVAQAAVRRRWPGILTVSLAERRPVAYWNERGLLTAQGVVFEPPERPQQPLPRLQGDNASAREVLKNYHWLTAQFAPLGLEVVALSKAQRGTWQVQLQLASATGGAESGQLIVVALGKQALQEKLVRFKTLYDSVLHTRMNEIERVDLRYTNGIAVEWIPALS